MSKSPLLIACVVTAGVILAGCNKKTEPQPDSTATNPINVGSSDDAKYSQWALALQSGQALTCTFTNTTSGDTAEYSVKGEKVSMTMHSTQEAQYGKMISDGEFTYVWNDTTKEGMKFPITDTQVTEADIDQAMQNVPDFSNEDELKSYSNDGEIDCIPGNVSDSIFVPPSDVAFQDLSALMQQSFDASSSEMTAEQKAQLEEMMKQFGQ